jgi:aromatic-L-amino-acid/L-tryptophan decarboxylase
MDALRKALNTATEETLDPDDWADVQALSHLIVDDAVGYLRDVRDRPVWQDPAEVRAFFTAPLPRLPAPLSEVYREVVQNVMAYPMATSIRASGPGTWDRAISPGRLEIF